MEINLEKISRIEVINHAKNTYSVGRLLTLYKELEDFDSLEIARQEAMKSTRPAAIICRTTKGNGWGGMQDTVDCHYLPISAKDRQSFVDSLVSGSERSSQPSPP